MGQNLALSIEDHAPVRRIFTNSDTVVLRELAEIGSPDDLEVPELNHNDEKSDGNEGNEVPVPPLEILQPLAI